MALQATPTAPADKLAAGVLLTETDVAALLSVATQTVRNWRARGEGPACVKLGKRAVRYPAEAVRAFMQGGAQ